MEVGRDEGRLGERNEGWERGRKVGREERRLQEMN